ncbi:MAG: arsenical pump-driving ATPase [Polyangiaceae bacterium]|jgi:arsenite-transporting ATPase|nr:arsenical pump-driving ATPase [Polyangiaceae bacterium]
MSYSGPATRNLFFTGKGGVGKTALACATAIGLADAGQRVLLVSTDPASNLDEMLGVELGGEPRAVPGVSGLSAMNIDPTGAAEDYRQRVIGPYVGSKSDAELAQLREQLSGACTTEIAAFDAFAGLLAGDTRLGSFDHVVFDTAPTGHTLRLLQLPKAWTTFLESNAHGASCLGPHSGLTMQHDRFAAAMRALGDPAQTTLVLAARPQPAALREAERTSAELEQLGLHNQELVLNAVFRASDPSDATAIAYQRRGEAAIAALPQRLRALPMRSVPLLAFDMVGVAALRALLADERPPVPATALAASPGSAPPLPDLASLVDEIAKSDHGLVMVMGKGGVGKTTIAAAIAVELARRGRATHLSTTDPAAHVAAAVAGEVDHLTLSRIDPAAETRAYTERVMARKGKDLDAEGRALLEEDLRSPCTEEVAVFHAFSRIVSEAKRGLIILDTAPTGHTLLLLDATGAYHRDVLRGLPQAGGPRLVTPLMRLQDPAYTKIIIVTLAEPTPVSEAAQLQADLRRAGIQPFAWVVNASLAASGTRDPVLQRRGLAERAQIERVQRELCPHLAVVPWLAEEPTGAARLAALAAPRGS